MRTIGGPKQTSIKQIKQIKQQHVTRCIVGSIPSCASLEVRPWTSTQSGWLMNQLEKIQFKRQDPIEAVLTQLGGLL
jgi:hypothetical protein